MNERVKYWVGLSDYDLETADAMLKSSRFLYVGFMYHQSIEKIIKAYFLLRKMMLHHTLTAFLTLQRSRICTGCFRNNKRIS